MFRPGILGHRNRLPGDVAIAVPVAWQTVALTIFGSMSLGVLFLSLAGYSRVETVAGTIAPETGIATIVPTRHGIIAALRVSDGQDVVAGA